MVVTLTGNGLLAGVPKGMARVTPRPRGGSLGAAGMSRLGAVPPEMGATSTPLPATWAPVTSGLPYQCSFVRGAIAGEWPGKSATAMCHEPLTYTRPRLSLVT